MYEPLGDYEVCPGDKWSDCGICGIPCPKRLQRRHPDIHIKVCPECFDDPEWDSDAYEDSDPCDM